MVHAYYVRGASGIAGAAVTAERVISIAVCTACSAVNARPFVRSALKASLPRAWRARPAFLRVPIESRRAQEGDPLAQTVRCSDQRAGRVRRLGNRDAYDDIEAYRQVPEVANDGKQPQRINA